MHAEAARFVAQELDRPAGLVIGAARAADEPARVGRGELRALVRRTDEHADGAGVVFARRTGGELQAARCGEIQLAAISNDQADAWGLQRLIHGPEALFGRAGFDKEAMAEEKLILSAWAGDGPGRGEDGLTDEDGGGGGGGDG